MGVGYLKFALYRDTLDKLVIAFCKDYFFRKEAIESGATSKRTRMEYEYINGVIKTLGVAEEDVCYAELVAPQDIRLVRNVTENRLKNKASKRNIEASNERLIRDDVNHRMESQPGEITSPNYIRIDNSNMSPEEAARLIKERFDFPDA
jgi:hypothetical protein